MNYFFIIFLHETIEKQKSYLNEYVKIYFSCISGSVSCNMNMVLKKTENTKYFAICKFSLVLSINFTV